MTSWEEYAKLDTTTRTHRIRSECLVLQELLRKIYNNPNLEQIQQGAAILELILKLQMSKGVRVE